MKEKYTYKKLEYIGEKVINWCINEFGLSKYHEYDPWLEIDMDDEDCSLMGEYVHDNNEIIIYPNFMDNMNEFIDTIIHEYTHYMQSPSWYTRYSNRRKELMGRIVSHPYEIEAYEVAKKNMKKCKKEVLK